MKGRSLKSGERGLGSVAGVLKVLGQFAFKQGTWGPRELARVTGLSKSTTLRILQTMVDEKFLTFLEKDSKYVIGSELWRLGMGLRHGTSLLTIIDPVLHKYVNKINESFYFFTHSEGKVIFEQFVECNRRLRFHVEIGIPYEIEKGSTGKVVLAFLPVNETKKIIENLKKDNPCLDVNKLTKEISKTRKKGYSFTMDEREFGVVGFCVPVIGLDNTFLGGIGLAIPVTRYRSDDHDRYVDIVRSCAGEISVSVASNDGKDSKRPVQSDKEFVKK